MIFSFTAILVSVAALLTLWKRDRAYVWVTNVSILLFLGLSIFVPTKDWENGDRVGGVPLVFFPSMIATAFLGVIAIWERSLKTSQFKNPLGLALISFLVWYLATAAIRGSALDGLPYVIGFFYTWFLLSFGQQRFAIPNEHLLKPVLIGIAVLVAASLGLSFLPSAEPYYIPLRYLNRNCGVMVLLAILPFCFVINERYSLRRIFGQLPLAAVLFLIYISQSRSAILAAAFFFAGMVFNYGRLKGELLKLLAIVLMFFLLLSGHKLIKPGEQETLIRRFEQMAVQAQERASGNEAVIEESANERITHLVDAWAVIQKNWLWGTGLGYKNYLRADHNFKIPRTAHNIVVNYFAQMGVFGFAIFVWINYLLLFSRQFRHSFPSKLFFLSVFVHLLFNDYYIQPLLWAFAVFLPLISWKATGPHPSSQS